MKFFPLYNERIGFCIFERFLGANFDTGAGETSELSFKGLMMK